jgi:TetR/AcrR family transcriptional repressor of nem operon
MAEAQHESKARLLDAALNVVRSKGYAATRIEDICEAAGLTKGSFFHHFKSKEALALEAAAHWGKATGGMFATAPYHAPADPLDRLLAYVDFRKALIRGALPEFTCFAGTTVQEVFDTHPAIRDACGATISGHAATLEADFAEALAKYHVAGDPKSLALFTQAAIQGGFVLAKAKQDPALAMAALDHLRRYLELMFQSRKEATT